MNQATMMGRLVRDPQVKYVENDKGKEMAIANFRLAVNRRYGEEADYFPCTAFGRLAEFVEDYLFQGIKIIVTGRVENDNYTNKDGEKVYGVCLKLNDIEFAESKNAQGNEDDDGDDDSGRSSGGGNRSSKNRGNSGNSRSSRGGSGRSGRSSNSSSGRGSRNHNNSSRGSRSSNRQVDEEFENMDDNYMFY